MLMYSRDHHNIVRQLSFKKKKISHLGWIDKQSNPSGFEIRNASWNLPLARLLGGPQRPLDSSDRLVEV